MDSLATYSMVEAGLGLAMNNALNGRAWSGGVRILPLDPPQIVEIGAATLPGPLPRRADIPRFFGTSPCGIPLGKILRFS